MNASARIHCEHTGDKAAPVLVILHGLFGDADNFRAVAQKWANDFHVIRMDLPGHGQSDTLPVLSHNAMAEAIEANIAQMGITHYQLMGHSLGGKVAMAMAGGEQRQRISQLIVVDIAPRFYPPHHTSILQALASLDLQSLTSRRDADQQLKAHIPEDGVRSFILKGLHRPNKSHFAWRFDLAGLQRDYPLIQEPPILKHTVTTPTLFVKGGDSDYLLHTDETVIRENFTNPQFKLISGAGHWPHAQKPDAFAHICYRFLKH